MAERPCSTCFPLLIENEVLCSNAKQLNCQFHTLNKCFETGCLKTFGKQGICQVNIFQAIFVYSKLIKTIKEQSGFELVDLIHQIVIGKLVSCETWQTEANKTNKVDFDELWAKLNTTDDEDEDIDSLDGFEE